jgi:hypothetical protein
MSRTRISCLHADNWRSSAKYAETFASAVRQRLQIAFDATEERVRLDLLAVMGVIDSKLSEAEQKLQTATATRDAEAEVSAAWQLFCLHRQRCWYPEAMPGS